MASAEFFLSADLTAAAGLMRARGARWVLAGDADHVLENAGAILGRPPGANALGYVLDRAPSSAPEFLRLVRQNAGGKLYLVNEIRGNPEFPPE